MNPGSSVLNLVDELRGVGFTDADAGAWAQRCEPNAKQAHQLIATLCFELREARSACAKCNARLRRISPNQATLPFESGLKRGRLKNTVSAKSEKALRKMCPKDSPIRHPTMNQLADFLHRAGESPLGGGRWSSTQVARLLVDLKIKHNRTRRKR